jgi:hypothetical protein
MHELTKKVILEITDERMRQVREEGWTPEHDDDHELGEMAIAAACYSIHSAGNYEVNHVPGAWPWDSEWWKPKNPRRDLVRAAALLVAEIERLDRAQ